MKYMYFIALRDVNGPANHSYGSYDGGDCPVEATKRAIESRKAFDLQYHNKVTDYEAVEVKLVGDYAYYAKQIGSEG